MTEDPWWAKEVHLTVAALEITPLVRLTREGQWHQVVDAVADMPEHTAKSLLATAIGLLGATLDGAPTDR